MQLEDRDGRPWLVCPNGCATEFEAPERKPPALEVESDPEPLTRARGAGQ
jgi:hypothetical protein